MHIVSYIIAFLTAWFMCSMVYAYMEDIFIKTFPVALFVSTVSWLVGEIVPLSIKISNKKKNKNRKDGLHI